MVDGVCTVIAARNASPTIARAIRSALRDSFVEEVVIIDDASHDNTAEVARQCDDGTRRLKVIRFETNRGPAAARNHAFECSRAPVISILDADDFFIDGRLSKMMPIDGWDIIADNIAFIDERDGDTFDCEAVAAFDGLIWQLDLATFARRNISRRGARRGELGFLKPLIRREFLEKHQLRYNERLRLGEDYDLYARALAAGAVFYLTNNCGYAAVIRADSLSGQHSTEDLANLAAASNALLSANLPSEAARAVQEHASHVRAKYLHRSFLDTKSRKGLSAAVFDALTDPPGFARTAREIFLDKFDVLSRSSKPGSNTAQIRYLFENGQINSN
ncbi:glycosyltransferase family 2 protein [Phyllobacterium sp. SB3]|uniref:glycosyltransferase family 2 protein n=1 Tax=Phyllobacterium sp. SB3 TaxID=3156073 RepID=UPI0032AF9A4A